MVALPVPASRSPLVVTMPSGTAPTWLAVGMACTCPASAALPMEPAV